MAFQGAANPGIGSSGIGKCKVRALRGSCCDLGLCLWRGSPLAGRLTSGLKDVAIRALCSAQVESECSKLRLFVFSDDYFGDCMPALKTYVGFISHAWKYHDEYERLLSMLKNAPNFEFRNSSVPKTDPIPTPITDAKLKSALDEQIRIANVVLILSGMYSAHSDWIGTEIAIAAKYQKPIIGVVPWGQQRIPDVVQTASKEMVRWNTDSIVAAIRKHAL